jgi:hypothetical protein
LTSSNARLQHVLSIVVEYMLTHGTSAQRSEAVGFDRANFGGNQVKKAVWKRIEDEKGVPNALLYSVRLVPTLMQQRVTAAQVLLCASLCGMADLVSECEYLLCLRISATADNDKMFEKTFGALPKGF